MNVDTIDFRLKMMPVSMKLFADRNFNRVSLYLAHCIFHLNPIQISASMMNRFQGIYNHYLPQEERKNRVQNTSETSFQKNAFSGFLIRYSIDLCSPDPCQNGGTCLPDGFCLCDENFEGDFCQTPVPPCRIDENYCQNGQCDLFLGVCSCEVFRYFFIFFDKITLYFIKIAKSTKKLFLDWLDRRKMWYQYWRLFNKYLQFWKLHRSCQWFPVSNILKLLQIIVVKF